MSEPTSTADDGRDAPTQPDSARGASGETSSAASLEALGHAAAADVAAGRARGASGSMSRGTALASLAAGGVALLAIPLTVLGLPLALGPLATSVTEVGVLGLGALGVLLPASLLAAAIVVVSARGQRPWLAAPLAVGALAWGLGAAGDYFAIALGAVESADDEWGGRMLALLDAVPGGAGARASGALVTASVLATLALGLALASAVRRGLGRTGNTEAADTGGRARFAPRHAALAALLSAPLLIAPCVAWLSGVPVGACLFALGAVLLLIASVSLSGALARDAHGGASHVAVATCAALAALALAAWLGAASLAVGFGAPPVTAATMSAARLAAAATALRGVSVATILAQIAGALLVVGSVAHALFGLGKRARPRLRDVARAFAALVPIAAVIAGDAYAATLRDELLQPLGRHPIARVPAIHPLRIVGASEEPLHVEGASAVPLYDVDLFVTAERALPPDGNGLPFPTDDAIDPIFDAALDARVAAARARGTTADRAGTAQPADAAHAPRAALAIAPDAALPALRLRRVLRAAVRAGAETVALYGSVASRARARESVGDATRRALPAPLTLFAFAPATCLAELPTPSLLRAADQDTQLLHAQITRPGAFQVSRRSGAGTGFLLTPDRPLRPHDLRAPAERPARVYVAAGDRTSAQAWASAICTLGARGFAPVLVLDETPGHPERALVGAPTR